MTRAKDRPLSPRSGLGVGSALVLLAMLVPSAVAASPSDARGTSVTPVTVPPSRVVIVTDTTDDAVVREAATRLQAELGAAGFEVVRMPLPPGDDLRSALERTARATHAFATAALFRSAAGATADLWIVDRVSQKTVVRTVEVGGASAPSVLAVRAVELLQASLLEATAPPAHRDPGHERALSQALPADVARWMTPVSVSARRGMLDGFNLEAGAVVLQSTGGIGPSLGPALRLAFGGQLSRATERSRYSNALAARLTIAGPMLGPPLRGVNGAVLVRQELAALELVYALDLGSRLVPVLSAGAGVHRLHAEGAARAPYVSVSGDIWSLMVGAGAGVGWRLTERTGLLLDMHALFLQPRPVITLTGERLGSAGRPTVAGIVGLLVNL